MSTTQILKQYFGYDKFREGQEHLINSILKGQDCLGIMPTGAGKSICFQVPALMMDGITLIISPLISLMKDQVNALTQAGISAAYINSSLTESQISLALDKAKNGVYKLLYVAPERLLTYDFLEIAKSIQISMLTVDEAHCISQWGQDFRPSYAKIPEFIAKLSHRPILSAFTATATPKVREDIISLLNLKEPTVLVTGFNRENLYFEVQKPKNKFKALIEFLQDKKDKSGIVYCSTRKNVEAVCQNLIDNGYNASRYHAGLADRERYKNQDDFLFDRVQIMVATNAFGMGIDKSNVSFVVHYNMPKDIESYYQEAGRAGRDGELAKCILLYSGQDVRTNLWLIENARDVEYPDKETEEILKERDRKRLREMTFYCATSDCLRSYILKYFGETPQNFCGNCGNCKSNYETVDITIDAQKILSCVCRMKERYGVKMVIDVLRGSKNEKITRLGFDKLSTYGISEKSESQLRDMINHLILNNFLLKTDAEYPLLVLGERANSLLQGREKVTMKLTKEKEKLVENIKKPKLVKLVDKGLFEKLRVLRYQIAKEQKVPAFTVFSDSTLTDMCMKIPKTVEEMLDVSGVGQVKLERYGRRFLEVISQNTKENSDDNQADLDEDNTAELDKTEIEISDEDVNISMIADKINSKTLQYGYKKISAVKINNWLVFLGYLEKSTENEKNQKLPTEKGVELGITSITRIRNRDEYKVNFFSKAAQEFIIEHLEDLMGYE